MKPGNILLAISVLVVVFGIPAIFSYIFADREAKAVAGTATVKITAPGVYDARILRWIDGDSATADIKLGFGVALLDQRLRLARVDTPERGEPDYAEARAVAEKCGVDVLIRGDVKDKYGRWLVEVYCEGAGDNLNNILIERGWSYGK